MSINVIIFSKNRACQLHACVESFYKYCKESNTESSVTILWKASTKSFKDGYEKMMTAFPESNSFSWKEEYSFKKQMLEMTNSTKHKFTMFLVDDDMFINHFSMKDKQFTLAEQSSIISLSIRLHSGATHCYPVDKPNKVPHFVKGCVWPWKQSEGDWAYPMSVDGNIYQTKNLNSLLGRLPFNNPSTFEASLDQFNKSPTSPEYMCCYPGAAKLINIPANLVQTHCNNRFANTESAESLNEKYLLNELIDIDKFFNLKANMVHFPIKLEFKAGS